MTQKKRYIGVYKSLELLVLVRFLITELTLPTYLPYRLYGLYWETSPQRGLRTYMPSALIPSILSYPALQLVSQLVHQRYVHPNPLVLGVILLWFPTPTTDRDRPVSRRSKPSSRAALIGEQPNPWNLLQPQDATSRHRGAKPPRRYELLEAISLLSPEYLLSVER